VLFRSPNHQNRYFVFDNDKKATCLASVDEYGIGFVLCRTAGTRLVLSKIGGIVSNSNGDIQYEWKWDRTAMNAGNPPASPITVNINPFFEFRFRDRNDMTLEFTSDSIKRSFDVSLKHARNDTYLDKCTKKSGKLLPKIAYTSLMERQNQWNEKMAFQRNILHPKSSSLSDLVRGVVTDLEHDFEGISQKMHTSLDFGTEWKSNALSQTLSEIPLIPTAGTEVGETPGFGTHIYSADSTFRSTAPPLLLNTTGGWRGDVDVRASLQRTHPTMKRSAVLSTASGRYSEVIVVNRTRVTPDNPQGRVTLAGLPLESLSWQSLKDNMARCAALASSPVFVILLLREGDPVGLKCEKIASAVNEMLDKAAREDTKAKSSGHGTTRFRMVKINVSDNNDALADLGVKTLPTFVMKHAGNIVYSGLLGGQKLTTLPQEYEKPQVLLIEPSFDSQIVAEKTLKRAGCAVYLCLNAQQAIEMVRQVSMNSTKCFDIVLISEDVQSPEVTSLGQSLSSFMKSNATIACGLVCSQSLSAREEARDAVWESYCTHDVSLVLSSPLSRVVTMAMRKPIKAHAIEHLLGMHSAPKNKLTVGLTVESLYAKMREVEAASASRAGNGRALAGPSHIGIKLSSEESLVRGTQLVKSTS